MAIPTKIVNAMGAISKGTVKKANEVYAAAQKAGHAPWFMWGYDPNSGNTEHHSGRALDFMIKDKDDGDWIRNYLWANRKRLRLRHVIWRQHITSAVVQPGVVRKMADRGNTTANHYDHVHVQFLDDGYSPAAPPPSKPRFKVGPTLSQGSRGAYVKRLQSGLNKTVKRNLVIDGHFGPKTLAAVKVFQKANKLQVDGRVGPNTQKALFNRGVKIY